MPIISKNLSQNFKILGIGLLLVVGIGFFNQTVYAATLTVNSTADTVADDGECTLREAITAANSDTASGVTAGECIAGSGSDTINFNITGTADFTNSGQNGYTITPSTALPIIKSTVVINGYSQPGASANTAPHPQPLNGVLLIRLDGTDSIGNGIQIGDGNPSADAGSNSEVRGLIVNGFTTWGMGTAGAPTGVIFAGNYLGVNPEGSAADANYEGIVGDGSDDSVTIGGPDAADRNLASGNTYSGIRVSDGGLDGQIVEGNIAGLAADGVTDLGNGTYGIAFNSANGFVRSNIISGNSVFKS